MEFSCLNRCFGSAFGLSQDDIFLVRNIFFLQSKADTSLVSGSLKTSKTASVFKFP